ncbi:uncharacterized protein LOC114410632 [Glycine soja]|uniref:uncharacterized protein LOC114410632 n=1 Tax=Glycine soja TaxID=3848 RepID=UPI00103D2E66|nr:uncharacterized protein LOC114410632 [Glycine soja]
MTTNIEAGNDDTWYLNSGCSNHMTGHKEWLVNFDMKKRSKVKFVDNRVIEAKGTTSDVLIQRKDGGQALITEVLYVHTMKNNLLSIGQLLQKGFSMNLHDDTMEIFDRMQKKILKAKISKNRTFQVKLGAFDS